MNRAIILARPDLTMYDLIDTATAIFSAIAGPGSLHPTGETGGRLSQQLELIARAYHAFASSQARFNFFGLRDFYAAVKHVALRGAGVSGGSDVGLVCQALSRNFGGLPGSSVDIQRRYLTLRWEVTGFGSRLPPALAALDLVRDNLSDPSSRHLLLVTDDDSTVDLLKEVQGAAGSSRASPMRVILGSPFPNERGSDEYIYRVLSNIIVHMEQGGILVLKGLQSLHGGELCNPPVSLFALLAFGRLARCLTYFAFDPPSPPPSVAFLSPQRCMTC